MNEDPKKRKPQVTEMKMSRCQCGAVDSVRIDCSRPERDEFGVLNLKVQYGKCTQCGERHMFLWI
jgi:hypothetical protein